MSISKPSSMDPSFNPKSDENRVENKPSESSGTIGGKTHKASPIKSDDPAKWSAVLKESSNPNIASRKLIASHRKGVTTSEQKIGQNLLLATNQVKTSLPKHPIMQKLNQLGFIQLKIQYYADRQVTFNSLKNLLSQEISEKQKKDIKTQMRRVTTRIDEISRKGYIDPKETQLLAKHKELLDLANNIDQGKQPIDATFIAKMDAFFNDFDKKYAVSNMKADLQKGQSEIREFLTATANGIGLESVSFDQIFEIIKDCSNKFSASKQVQGAETGASSFSLDISRLKMSPKIANFMKMQGYKLDQQVKEILKLPLGPARDKLLIQQLKLEDTFIKFCAQIMEENVAQKDVYIKLINGRNSSIESAANAFHDINNLKNTLEPTQLANGMADFPLLNRDQDVGNIIKNYLKTQT